MEETIRYLLEGKKRESIFTAKMSSVFMLKRWTIYSVNEITKERSQ